MTLLGRIRPPFAGHEPEVQKLFLKTQSVGQTLRNQRLALGIDIGKAARGLKIKPAYLLAIEEGRPSLLPGATYAIGFVRSYSEYLGLDGAEVVRQFKSECAELKLNGKPDLTFPMPLGEGGLPAGKVMVLAALLAACGYGLWYYSSASERGSPERVIELPPELLASKAEPKGPSKLGPAVAADPLAEGRGVNRASVTGLDRAEPVSSTAGEARRSGLTLGPDPLGSGPSTPETTSIPAGPPSAKRVANSPPAATGAAGAGPFRAQGLAAAVAMASPEILAHATPPQSAEPAILAKVDARASPGARSASPGVPRIGAATAASVEGGPHPTRGPDHLQSRIVLRANADSWIQIRAQNHSVLFEGVLKRGDIYRVPDLSGLTMRAGNAGGLDVMIDGKPAASLGPMGAVRNVSLSPQSLTRQGAAHN